MCQKCERKMILQGLITVIVDEMDPKFVTDLMESLSNNLVENVPGFKKQLLQAGALQIVDDEPEYEEKQMFDVMKGEMFARTLGKLFSSDLPDALKALHEEMRKSAMAN